MTKRRAHDVEEAQQRWGSDLSPFLLQQLSEICQKYAFSVIAGDIILLNSRWYVTYTGLIGLAKRSRCAGIHVAPVEQFCDPEQCRWAFEAKVFRSRSCKGFVGYGDADPTNVSRLVRGAEMRVAETRAVNRALRKAYGIGICSVEEIGCAAEVPPKQNCNGHHPLRDRLCDIVRQHKLDASLVKAYAADYCGAKQLRDATRQQVSAFVEHLGELATNDPSALMSTLKSYSVTAQEGVA